MKIIYSGLESSGKSLKLAMKASDLVHRNAKWKEIAGISRPIVSNLRFGKEFVDYADERGISIEYWTDLDDLIKMRNCDVLIDEVGTYFDSRLWADLSLDSRRWLAQAAKLGVEIYGTAQDFAQVDKSFRRLVNQLFLVRKVVGSGRPSATKPPIKRIWGVCAMTELDPQGYDEEKKLSKGGFIPHMFTIQRKYCEIFDTTQEVAMSAYPPLRKIVRTCPEDGFVKVKYV